MVQKFGVARDHRRRCDSSVSFWSVRPPKRKGRKIVPFAAWATFGPSGKHRQISPKIGLIWEPQSSNGEVASTYSLWTLIFQFSKRPITSVFPGRGWYTTSSEVGSESPALTAGLTLINSFELEKFARRRSIGTFAPIGRPKGAKDLRPRKRKAAIAEELVAEYRPRRAS